MVAGLSEEPVRTVKVVMRPAEVDNRPSKQSREIKEVNMRGKEEKEM